MYGHRSGILSMLASLLSSLIAQQMPGKLVSGTNGKSTLTGLFREGSNYLKTLPAVCRAGNIQNGLCTQLCIGIRDADSIPALKQGALQGDLHNLQGFLVTQALRVARLHCSRIMKRAIDLMSVLAIQTFHCKDAPKRLHCKFPCGSFGYECYFNRKSSL